jgi:tRNA-dihydrouridine synthase
MKKIYLAPLQGITDPVFRTVYNRHFKGLKKSYTPFLEADSKSNTPTKYLDHQTRDRKDGISTLIPQVISKDGEGLVRFSHILKDFGFSEFNLNMGCPYPTVTGKGRGSALLQTPRIIEDMLDLYFKDGAIDLSLKVRIGFKDINQLNEIIPVIKNYPVSELIIHPRTAEQMYEGTIHYDKFIEAAEAYGKDVIFNGDIYTFENYTERRKVLPQNCNGIMIGRGLIYNPLLLLEILEDKAISAEERLLKTEPYFKDLISEYETALSGESHFLQKMKNLAKYILPGFVTNERVIKKLLKTQKKEHFISMSDEIFGDAHLRL